MRGRVALKFVQLKFCISKCAWVSVVFVNGCLRECIVCEVLALKCVCV